MSRPRITDCRWVTLLGTVAVLLTVTFVSGSKPAGRTASRSPTTQPEPVEGVAPKAGSLEHLGVWISAARQTYERVRDYQCTFTKRERVEGILQDEHTAVMLVRSKPFSVHLKFATPRAAAGKEASYVQGRNDGKMRAKGGGALGLVGYVAIDPNDPKAMKGTRHAITEAGIGNLIEQLAKATAAVPGVVRPGVAVIVSEFTVDDRPCVRFDITDPNANGIVNQPRTLVYFDKNTNLPVRYEGYDARGNLIELFAYTNLKFNIGLTDSAFP